MESYCLKCRIYTENINPQVLSTSNGKLMILSKYAICNSKKSKFINEQETKGLWSKWGIKTSLGKIPILGDILLWMNITMNKIVNKFLLAGDKFLPERHLRKPRFTYSACGQFTKNKERIQTFKETGNTSYIYKTELDKACFQHDMPYGDFKDFKKKNHGR